MKTLYLNCRLLSGETSFCTEGGRFVPVLPPFAARRDLNGAWVLPAFPDAHSHLLAYALSFLQADGTGLQTPQQMADAARAFAAAHGLGADALVTIKNAERLPPPASLDGEARPLHVQARSGHAGLFNAAAKRLLRLPEDAGILEEGAYLAAVQQIPMPADGAVFRAFLRAQADYLAHGFSLAQEGILQPAMFPVYEMLLSKKALALPVAAYPAPDGYDEARRRFADAENFTVGGMKIFLDGSPQQRTAYLSSPYEGGGRGMPTMTEAEVTDACRFAAARGAQLLAHCNGDGAADIFLAALARLTERERSRIRPVIVHAQLIRRDQTELAARLGAMLSFFPAHVLHWGDVHLRNLGRERAARISPARDALGCRVPFTLHQDTPVCPPDPLEAAACAVLRRTASGAVFAEQAIGARDALRALTETAALQYGLHDRGRIAPGRRADFLVLEGDPLRDIAATHVRETYLRGRCVCRGHAPCER